MRFGWPWESRRLGEHQWVTRPWRPHRDPRVHNAVWTVFAGIVVAAVWHLQGEEAPLPARMAAATLATLLLIWCWRAWGRRDVR